MQVSWDPGLKGRGLQVSLSSAQGQHAGGRTTLWHDANVLTHPNDIGAGGLDTPTRTDSEVAYGLTAFGGLLTPYSRLQLAGYGRALSVGTTWHARPAARLPLRVGVEATRSAHTIGGAPKTAVVVHMTAPF